MEYNNKKTLDYYLTYKPASFKTFNIDEINKKHSRSFDLYDITGKYHVYIRLVIDFTNIAGFYIAKYVFVEGSSDITLDDGILTVPLDLIPYGNHYKRVSFEQISDDHHYRFNYAGIPEPITISIDNKSLIEMGSIIRKLNDELQENNTWYNLHNIYIYWNKFTGRMFIHIDNPDNIPYAEDLYFYDYVLSLYGILNTMEYKDIVECSDRSLVMMTPFQHSKELGVWQLNLEKFTRTNTYIEYKRQIDLKNDMLSLIKQNTMNVYRKIMDPSRNITGITVRNCNKCNRVYIDKAIINIKKYFDEYESMKNLNDPENLRDVTQDEFKECFEVIKRIARESNNGGKTLRINNIKSKKNNYWTIYDLIYEITDKFVLINVGNRNNCSCVKKISSQV